MWPQIVFLIIVMVGLILNIIFEGEATEGHFDTINYILKYGFILFILYMGGFFDCFFKTN
jgi:hypothetical protein